MRARISLAVKLLAAAWQTLVAAKKPGLDSHEQRCAKSHQKRMADISLRLNVQSWLICTSNICAGGRTSLSDRRVQAARCLGRSRGHLDHRPIFENARLPS